MSAPRLGARSTGRCRSSIRMVAMSLTLSDAAFILAGPMQSVWPPGTGSSTVGAGVDIVSLIPTDRQSAALRLFGFGELSVE